MVGNIRIAVNFFLLVLNRKDDFPDIQKVLIFLKRRSDNSSRKTEKTNYCELFTHGGVFKITRFLEVHGRIRFYNRYKNAIVMPYDFV